MISTAAGDKDRFLVWWHRVKQLQNSIYSSSDLKSVMFVLTQMASIT